LPHRPGCLSPAQRRRTPIGKLLGTLVCPGDEAVRPRVGP
jgi:hypothetical protein